MRRSTLAVVAVAALAGACTRDLDAAADHLGGEVDVPGDPALDVTALLRKGPIVQNVTSEGATVLWETDLPARSVIEVRELPATPPEAAALGAPVRAVGRTYVVNYVAPLERYEPVGAYLHEVRVHGLAPARRYEYRLTSVAAPPAGARPPTGRFVTAPAGPADFTAVLFGDNRGAAARFGSVVATAVKMNASLALATGDLVGEGTNGADWQTFFDVGAVLLRDVPLYTTLGNHDVYLYGIPLFDAYLSPPRPALPYAIASRWVADAEDVYSFDWGRAHFVMLNSNQGSGTTALQADWLRRDLADARARGAAPIIAFMHHPLFTCADHEPALALRDAWWPLLRDGGVSAVVAGHNHVYERFDIDGIAVVTSGGAGAPTYDADRRTSRPEAAKRKAAAERLHAIRLEVKASGTAVGTVVDAENGATIDTFVLGLR